jgi:hypothetical protein
MQNFSSRVRKMTKQKTISSSYLFVRPSIRMVRLAIHWTDCHEIWYLSIFQKSIDKFKI